jgi:Flp pilus assembly protein TadG
MLNRITDYLRQSVGALSVAFALAIPVVVGSAGFAVDLSMAHMVKQRLANAIDAAALAAAASAGGSSASAITAKVTQFFYMNYPLDKVGSTYDLVVTVSGDDITVSAKSRYQTTFAKLLGVDELVVSAKTTVTKEILGLEVAMVLDVTGSMTTNNNIGALKTAATNFLDVLCSSSTCSSLVKIGIVPFANTVNVGPYGLGKNPSGSTYDTAFVNNPSGKTFNQSSSTQWWGCILERTPPEDTKNYGAGWKWNMYSNPSGGINNGCNKSYILPLTSVYGTIKAKISSLVASGNTLSNIGMVWGYRLLSPEAPFREGSAWGDVTTKKVAIFMTDGDNNIGGAYSAYGNWSTLKLTDRNLDDKLATTCQNMKNDGITIYTITFTSGIDATTKSYFKNCASGADKYYDAPSQSSLLNAFEQIARELSNIHIKS